MSLMNKVVLLLSHWETIFKKENLCNIWCRKTHGNLVSYLKDNTVQLKKYKNAIVYNALDKNSSIRFAK
jgi:hypothetical protein